MVQRDQSSIGSGERKKDADHITPKNEDMANEKLLKTDLTEVPPTIIRFSRHFVSIVALSESH